MKKIVVLCWLLLSVAAFSQSEHWFSYKPSFPDVRDFEGFFTHSYDIEPLDVIAMANDSQLQNTSLGRYVSFPKKDGLLDGMVVISNPKEQRIEMPFEKGKANGKAVLYDTKGNVSLETQYKDNKRNGLRKLYSSYRSYVFEANYKDDKLVGKIKVYEGDRYGDWYYLFPNDLKKGVVEAFTGEGIKSVEIPIINSRVIHGDVRYFDKAGKVFMVVPYKNGEIHGTVNLKDKEGKPWYSLRFKNGKPIGKHLKYHNDFKTLEKEEYYDEEGNKTGVWKYYDPNGKLEKIIDKYENDVLNGFEKAYSNGKLMTERHYLNGKMHGKSTQYKGLSPDILIVSYYENDVYIKYEEYKKETRIKEGLFKNRLKEKESFFDKNGNIIHENHFGENGKPIGNHKSFLYSDTLEYKLTSDEDYDEKGVKTRYYIYQYDGSISKMYFSNGKQHGKQINYYAYNDTTVESYYWQGKKVSEEEFNKLSEEEKSK